MASRSAFALGFFVAVVGCTSAALGVAALVVVNMPRMSAASGHTIGPDLPRAPSSGDYDGRALLLWREPPRR